MAYENHLIDKRVVERNISKGLVDPEALKAQVEALPDREANCVRVSLDGEADDSSDDDLGPDIDDEDDEDDEDDAED